MSDKPFLTTERLELWQPRPADFLPIVDVVSNPSTGQYLGSRSGLHDHAARFMRGAGSWFLYGYGPLLLRFRGQDAIAGNCGVFHTFRGLGDDFDDNPEAGWVIAAEHVGKGLASEAMEAILAWFEREHGPHRIVCMISVGNDTSLHLAGKLGFTFMREAELSDGDVVRLFERVPEPGV